jgi:predicted ATPase
MNASLHVRNDLKNLPLCTNFAESFAELANSDPAGTTRIVQCVEEAFCHTVEGAYEKGEDGEIILHAEDRAGWKSRCRTTGCPSTARFWQATTPARPPRTRT